MIEKEQYQKWYNLKTVKSSTTYVELPEINDCLNWICEANPKILKQPMLILKMIKL